MKLRAFLLSLLFVAFGLRAEDYEARVFTGTDGGKLPYRLLKPQKYDVNQKYPLVILLHGAGERGDDNTNQLKWGGSLFTKPEVREKFASFVVVPQCPNNEKWVEMDWGGDTGIAPADPGSTQKLLLGMIEAVQKEFSIDPDRLYLTGLSMGGFGTWDLITRLPEKFAAAAPICGGGDKTKAAAAKPVPVWAFHGDADNVVKPIRTKDMVEGLKAAGGQVAHTVYAGVAHNSWESAFAEPNFLPWMFAQRRGQPAQKMDLAVSHNTILAMPPENVFPGAGPLQLADWFKKLWMQRRVEFARTLEKDRNAIVFLGDSITQGWGSLAKDFPNLKTANRGISGDTSRGVRYRLREDVLELNPKAVSLLIGTNDLALGGTPEQVVDNVKAIIAELQKQNANIPIVINRVMPRGPQPGQFPDKIVKLNALFDALVAADKRLTICDTWTIFDDGKGGAKKEEFGDLLHPNAKGYAKWKEALDAVFAKLKL
jgi:poly(3-hydroxybutyrate) depolymerase/lysophospholipase L1-like esterase